MLFLLNIKYLNIPKSDHLDPYSGIKQMKRLSTFQRNKPSRSDCAVILTCKLHFFFSSPSSSSVAITSSVPSIGEAELLLCISLVGPSFPRHFNGVFFCPWQRRFPLLCLAVVRDESSSNETMARSGYMRRRQTGLRWRGPR